MLLRKHKVALGFTVVELMVVIGVMGILAAIVAPRWEEYRSRMVVGEAANTFCTAFREARDEALLEQCEMSIEVSNANKTITIYRRSDNVNFEIYRKFGFPNNVYICGTGNSTIVIGQGGRITSVAGPEAKSDSSIPGYSIPYYDVVCSSQSTLAEDHIFLTPDGRASIGASL